MKYNPMEIGERIKKLRRDSAYSQVEFAELIGISREHLGNIERGVKNPSIDLIIDISEICSISLDYLVLGQMGTADVQRKLHLVAQELIKIAKELEM